MLKITKTLGKRKPFYLSTKDRWLLTIEYVRECRIYFHLGQSYGVHETACYRNCRWLKKIVDQVRVRIGE